MKSPYKTNDASAGFDRGWIEVMGINERLLAQGTTEAVEKAINQFKDKNLNVFSGNYIGINPLNPNDVWDLRTPFFECENRSAPSFCYVLRDVIEVEE